MEHFFPLLCFMTGNYVTGQRASCLRSLSTSFLSSSKDESVLKRQGSVGEKREALGAEGHVIFWGEKHTVSSLFSMCANLGDQHYGFLSCG